MDANNMNQENLTFSDEDKLLEENASSARTKPADIAKPKQTKVNRNKMIDANRLRAHSLGDISQSKQRTLRYHFGKPHSDAVKDSTLMGIPNAALSANIKSADASSVPFVFGTSLDGAANASTSKDILKTDINAQGNSTTLNDKCLQDDKIAVNTANRPATLNDIKRVMEANATLGSMMPPTQTQTHTIRPPLNATSTPNKTDGAVVKKRRRGGKKYRAMMEKRAQRDNEGQNSPAADKNVNKDNIQQQQNTHTPTNAGNKHAKPSASTSMHRHGLQGQNTAKRGRVTGGTPPDATQKPKKANTNAQKASTATVTMADAVIDANLVVAVYDSPAPGIILPMDQVKYKQLYESINNTLFSDIEKCSVIPTFKENKHVRGVMKVQCSTPAAKAWLIDAIKRTLPLWANMNLNAVDYNKLPQQIRVLGLFPNCKLNAQQIRSLLNATNPHISAGSWTILSSKTTDKGAHVAFGMNELQLEMLKASRFKLFFGAGSALFKDISKKNANPKHDDQAEMDMDIQSTDLSDAEDQITVIINNATTVQQQGTGTSTNAQDNFNPGANSVSVPNAVTVTANTNITPQDTQNADGVTDPVIHMDTGTTTETGAT